MKFNHIASFLSLSVVSLHDDYTACHPKSKETVPIEQYNQTDTHKLDYNNALKSTFTSRMPTLCFLASVDVQGKVA
ncbi:MAG: hypothetical protein IJA85_01455 [Clostridia bacterium]|nr:hypothetical protein [Clostridia bacterium]